MLTILSAFRRANFLLKLEEILPGFTLVAIVTAAAYGLRQTPGLEIISPMFSAVLIGMVFANFTTVPQKATPGVVLLGKKMLRLAVALLGLQLTLAQIFDAGATGVLLLALIVVATYAFTITAASIMSVDAVLGRLLAAGTSICGASAIAAANGIEQAGDEDVSYAIACITLLGTLTIVLYPLLAPFLALDAIAYGFWAGASIHEVAQVVATGFQYGDEAGEFAVMVKLSRVLLLAPLLVAVALLLRRGKAGKGTYLTPTQIVPLFVTGFIALMLANTFDLVPDAIKTSIVQVTPVVLTGALGAIGLGTRFEAIRARGFRPFLLATLASLFISSASLLVLPLLS